MADADVLVIGTGPKLRTALLLSGRPVPSFISARMPPHTCKSHNVDRTVVCKKIDRSRTGGEAPSDRVITRKGALDRHHYRD